MIKNIKSSGKAVSALPKKTIEVAPLVTYPQGIDVSSYQGSINWQQVKDDGIKFAFIKATEYLTVDTTFGANWGGAKNVNMIRGPYLFFRSSKSGVDQANHLIDTIETQEGQPWPSQTGDLPPVIDIEYNDTYPQYDSFDPGWTVAGVLADLQACLDTIEQRTGFKAIIYTNYNTWVYKLGNPTGFNAYPLWVAAWGASEPLSLFGGWADWTFWQYTDAGSVDGISGNVDRDYFGGTYQELVDLTYQPPPPPPPSGLPGTGAFQALGDYAIGNTVHRAFWRGNKGWFRKDTDPTWSGPIPIDALPGSGNMQASTNYAVGSTLYQEFWRGNKGYRRTVPLNGGQPDWSNASGWTIYDL